MGEKKILQGAAEYSKKHWFSLSVKRVCDFIAAFFAILLLLPFWLILPVAIKCDSKGKVLFVQKRLGKNGREFSIFKYRTMIPNAEQQADGVLVAEGGDPRITKVGRFLRKTSLDELPQLFNVLFGSMSFIGPRPPVVYHPYPIEGYDENQLKRFFVRPGISGLAQIKVRDAVGWDKKIEYDVEYVEKRNLFYDAKILFLTFASLLKGQAF